MNSSGSPLLVVDDLRKDFQAQLAVDGVSFTVHEGETLGIIGESGSGKSTTARCLLRLIEPTSGSVRFRGVELTSAGKHELRELRKHIQIVFQNPYNALDPSRSVGSSIAEPLSAHGIGTRRSRRARVEDLLEQVGLDRRAATYRPQEFSGGERQRLGIARALAVEPALIVCDEPVSALDVSVQAQILNLLRDIQDERGIAYVFISHDIGVVRIVSDQIAVMKDGKFTETGPADQVCNDPQDPYTRSLIEAARISTTRESRAREAVVRSNGRHDS